MSTVSQPPAAIRTAFEQAARAHDALSIQGGRSPAGATRQIAAPQRTATVQDAIANAAQQTTIDFDFLIAQAQVESAMNPDARARTSSATGLYQFIESTWLGTMQRHGARFGLGDVASQINLAQDGTAYVNDPAAREAILAMRSDPQVAALMAAGLAEDNRAHLAPILGRQPDHGELYLAHFLGAGGAGRFLSAMAENPNQPAAALFRAPAAANHPIFYEANGSPRSLAQVMGVLSAKIERARDYAGLMPARPYQAASLAPDAAAVPPPYIIASEDVFGPMNPPTLTGRNRPTISGATPLTMAEPTSRGSMSGLLRNTFGENPQLGSEQANGQVRRAYEQLKAFGL